MEFEKQQASKFPIVRRKTWIILAVIISVVLLSSLAAIFIINKQNAKRASAEAARQADAAAQVCPTPTACVDTSKALSTKFDPSHGTCKGKGPISFTTSPIPPDQIALVLPLGTMIGGHTTPIDHGYIFGTRVHDSVPNEYPVLAPADGVITEMSLSSRTSTNEGFVDHALTISYNCSIYTHFLNMDSFDAALVKKAGTIKDNEIKQVSIPVKSGQVIGRTGTHGIDIYVWNFDKKQTVFTNPDHYDKAEGWKNYTVDPFEYFVPAVKQQILAKNPRTAAPTGGKIDYDIPGRAIGNWFKIGSGGYGGNTAPGEGNNFWSGHLSLVPDALDPSGTTFSIGDWKTGAEQFAVPRNSPNPRDISVASGLVKFELYDEDWIVAATGIPWNRTHMQGPVRYQPRNSLLGTAIVQMIDDEHLKFESFPGKSPSGVSGFTSAAATYER